MIYHVITRALQLGGGGGGGVGAAQTEKIQNRSTLSGNELWAISCPPLFYLTHDMQKATRANVISLNNTICKILLLRLTCGGRNYILKWVFCSDNFGRSKYSLQRVQTSIIRKLVHGRICN